MVPNEKLKSCPLLVVGIGNILLRDEGVGVHVVSMLAKMDLPHFVEVLDGGTAGADLLDSLCDRAKVIFIDAVDADCEPGTILRLKPEDLPRDAKPDISLHEFGLFDTLAMARQLNSAPGEVVILGIRPEDLRPGLELSATIAARIPAIVNVVLQEIDAFAADVRG